MGPESTSEGASQQDPNDGMTHYRAVARKFFRDAEEKIRSQIALPMGRGRNQAVQGILRRFCRRTIEKILEELEDSRQSARGVRDRVRTAVGSRREEHRRSLEELGAPDPFIGAPLRDLLTLAWWPRLPTIWIRCRALEEPSHVLDPETLFVEAAGLCLQTLEDIIQEEFDSSIQETFSSILTGQHE